MMKFAGGCQCGRIRYCAVAAPNFSCVCYCRMCQKASGGPFMAFVRFLSEDVHWEKPPEVFASSTVAERGFCSTCGTPLSYRRSGSANISLTLNTLDDPGVIRSQSSFLGRQKVPWISELNSLPNKDEDLSIIPGFVSNQP